MSKTPKKTDLLLVARYLDGELPATDRSTFEARLHREPALQKSLDEAREQQSLIRAADPSQDMVRAPAGIADSVMAQVRGMPHRDELRRLVEGDELADSAASIGRRLLVAAGLLFFVGLLVSTSLIQPPDDTSLVAQGQEMSKLREKARVEKRRALEDGKGETKTSPGKTRGR